MTTASLLKTDDKTIDQIQSIFQLKEVKYLSKQAIRGTNNLTIVFNNKKLKKKANNNNEYYNYYKLGHFGQDYIVPNKRLNRVIQ